MKAGNKPVQQPPDVGHACLDILFAIVILAGFGYTLYRSVLPGGYLVFSVVASVFGACWLAWALARLVRGMRARGAS
jgi:hypothetical protein